MVSRRSRGNRNLPDRDRDRLPQDPSPAEIRRRCRRIQEEWSEAVRKRRTAVPTPRWSVPVVQDHPNHVPEVQ